jgi:hypothetical protein
LSSSSCKPPASCAIDAAFAAINALAPCFTA